MKFFKKTNLALIPVFIVFLLFVSGCRKEDIECKGRFDATYFDDSQGLAEKYMPYFDINPEEKYEFEQVHYKIKRKDDGRTAIEYWAEWNYSQSTYFENLFSRAVYGEKFDHEFDLEPVFVYLNTGTFGANIERATYDAKHYVRGTIKEGEMILAEETHPIITVIKNSHGYKKFRNNKFKLEQLKTNYTLIPLDKLIIDKHSKILESSNPPMTIAGVINDPWCYKKLRRNDSIFSIVDYFYGDHSGYVFYEILE